MSEQAVEKQMEMPKHGQMCWFELATTNIEECKKFYSELFGWNFKKNENVGQEMDYHEFSGEGGESVGGFMQMTDELKNKKTGEFAPSHWMNYISVDDVDASAEKVKELGGSVCVLPTDIPNVGRFSVVNDPTGATFSLITLESYE